MKKKTLTILLVLSLVFVIVGCSGSKDKTLSPSTPTTTSTVTNSQEALEVSYEELARYPDNYFKKSIKLKGQITQVVDAGDNNTLYLLAVNDNHNHIAIVGYNGDFSNGRILNGDEILFYGLSGGLISTDTANNGNVTCPSMMATTYEQQ